MNEVLKLINDYGLKFGILLIIILGLILLIKYIVEIVLNNMVSNKYTNKIAKYENTLQKKTLAYKFILEKELKFYEVYYESASKLVTNIQDVKTNCLNYIKGENDAYEGIKKYFISILETIPEIKSNILMYESYVDLDVMKYISSLIKKLQEEILPLIDKIIEKNENKDYEEQIEKSCDEILVILSLISVKIRERYNKLIEEE